MIHMDLQFSEIDYEASFHDLFPRLLNKISQQEPPHLLLRFIQKLGDDTPGSVMRLMQRLPLTARDELLCSLVNAYEAKVRDLLTQYLDKTDWAGCFQIGGICLEQREPGCICVHLREMAINYSALMALPAVKKHLPARMGAFSGVFGFAANKAEKYLLSFKPVVGMIQYELVHALEHSGLHAHLDEVAVLTAHDAAPAPQPAGRLFSPELEDILLDAVVACLRELG